MERIGDKVREIIPPTEADVVYAKGKVANADAMSKEYIEEKAIRQYVDNPKCTIILFENPPYRDDVSDNSQKRAGVIVREPFVQQELKKALSTLPNSNISTARDLSNQFIWSGFKYYMRQATDSYILFSPIKYWKSLGLADKQFGGGVLFNREYFHASAFAIACILWHNIGDTNESAKLDVFDIVGNELKYIKPAYIRKCHNAYSTYYDKSRSLSDIETNTYCEYSGYEAKNRKCDGKSYCGDDIIGYLRTDSFSIDAKHIGLVRCTLYGIRGFYLRPSNYIRSLPLFAGKTFPQNEWYDRDVYFTTSDGGDAYTKDKDFLKSCLIYTCLSNQNKCLTFDGSDGRHYQNELCFDNDTLASRDLKAMKLDEEEQALMDLWYKILAEAKQTANYNPAFTYGIYQITKELNTFDEDGKTKIYHHPELNGDLITLRSRLKEYYKSHITEKMFKYELLK